MMYDSTDISIPNVNQAVFHGMSYGRVLNVAGLRFK